MGKYVNDGKVEFAGQHDLDDLMMELGELLGVGKRASTGRYHMADICTAKSINMDAKFKPTRHTKLVNMSSSDFKGTLADNNNNIFFSIKVNAPEPTSTFDEGLEEFHNATFTYIPPDGTSTQKFRIRDFHKYRHGINAVPSARFVQGDNFTAYYNDADWSTGGIQVHVRYSSADAIYAVDFTEILYGSNETVTFSNVYPCILITKPNGRSYISALLHPDTNEAEPLIGSSAQGQNQGELNATMYVRLSAESYDNGIESSNVNGTLFANLTGCKATVFLLKSGAQGGVYLDAARTISLEHQWVPLSLRMLGNAKAFILKGAVGATFNTKWYTLVDRIFYPSAISALKSTSGLISTISVGLGYEGDEDSTAVIDIKVVLSLRNGGIPVTKTGIYNPSSTIVVQRVFLFTTDELGVNITPSYIDFVDVTVTSTVGSSSETRRKTYRMVVDNNSNATFTEYNG